ncbi:hypothetical protein B0H17DRAFT_1135536 [Mycena rosella]|uniref:BRCT domain-containing protein n=1 Tax=Mycena rosella TaxID=1033263 RepID=A0AAD7GH06_MYCRO|nr:hypothetical protein B0H17DRAFT_1135536 [Mycena rosella]
MAVPAPRSCEPSSAGQRWRGGAQPRLGEGAGDETNVAPAPAPDPTPTDEPSADPDADYVIVRLVSGSALYLAESSPLRAFRAPDTHVSFVPLGVRLPVLGADRITLSFSGRDISDLAPVFSRNTTHLLCPGERVPNYACARQWGVPVVDIGWLAAMAQHGTDMQAFLVLPAEGNNVRKDKGKDKGKEKEETETMQDTYNEQLWYGLLHPFIRAALTTGYSTDSQDPTVRWAARRPRSPARRSGARRLRARHRMDRAHRARACACADATQHDEQQQQRGQAARVAGDDGRRRWTAARLVVAGARAVVVVAIAATPRGERVAARARCRRVSPRCWGNARWRRAHRRSWGAQGSAGARCASGRSHSRQPSDALPVLMPQVGAGELSVFGGGRLLSPGPDAYEGLSTGDEQIMRVMYEDSGQCVGRLGPKRKYPGPKGRTRTKA